MTHLDRQNWRGRFFRYAPLIFWIGVIFFLSSSEGSAEQTSRIIGPILNFFFPSLSQESRVLVHFYIRKLAHFTEYAILAFWAVRALSTPSQTALRNYRHLIAMALVVLIAGMDEFNQSFESSRTSSIWDVAIDTIGGLVMILLLKLIKK